MAESLGDVALAIKLNVKGEKKSLQYFREVRKSQKARHIEEKKFDSAYQKSKKGLYRTEINHYKKIQSTHKKINTGIKDGNAKAERSLKKQLKLHERMYQTSMKSMRNATKYGGGKILGGLKFAAKGVAIGGIGVIIGKLLTKAFKNYTNVMDMTKEAPKIHGDYIESKAKAEVIFAQLPIGDSPEALKKAKELDTLYKDALAFFIKNRTYGGVKDEKGKTIHKGTGLGIVEMYDVLGHLAAQFKGFGYQGKALIQHIDDALLASVDVTSMYNKATVKDPIATMTKGYIGETIPAKERYGIDIRNEKILELFEENQMMTKKFLTDPYGVKSIKELTKSQQRKAMAEARLYWFKYQTLVKVGAQGDYERTKDSYGNLVRMKNTVILDYKSALGGIVSEKSRKQLSKTIDAYKAEIEKISAAKTPEEKRALYEKFGGIGKLLEISNLEERELISTFAPASKITASAMVSIRVATKSISDVILKIAPSIMSLIDAVKEFFISNKTLSEYMDDFVKKLVAGLKRAL